MTVQNGHVTFDTYVDMRSVEDVDDEHLDDVIAKMHGSGTTLVSALPCDCEEDVIRPSHTFGKMVNSLGSVGYGAHNNNFQSKLGSHTETVVIPKSYSLLTVLIHLILVVLLCMLVMYCWMKYHRIEFVQLSIPQSIRNLMTEQAATPVL